MSTATATAVSKTEQATQLRDQARTMNQELTELRSKLAHASGALAILNDKKRKFTEEAARGRTPKPGEIAALNVAIDEAQIPFDGLTAAVKSKEAALATVRANLETLDYEISIETQRAARQARFQALEKQGRGVTAEIAEMLRVLIEVKLPELDDVRDSLTREFVNVGGALNAGPGNPEATAARALIHQMEGQFFDGPYLKAERELLRAGWQPRGESGLELTVRTLRPPR